MMRKLIFVYNLMFYCNADENGKSFKWDTNWKKKFQTVWIELKTKWKSITYARELVEKKQKGKYWAFSTIISRNALTEIIWMTHYDEKLLDE